jgi:hypothetical protein
LKNHPPAADDGEIVGEVRGAISRFLAADADSPSECDLHPLVWNLSRIRNPDLRAAFCENASRQVDPAILARWGADAPDLPSCLKAWTTATEILAERTARSRAEVQKFHPERGGDGGVLLALFIHHYTLAKRLRAIENLRPWNVITPYLKQDWSPALPKLRGETILTVAVKFASHRSPLDMGSQEVGVESLANWTPNVHQIHRDWFFQVRREGGLLTRLKLNQRVGVTLKPQEHGLVLHPQTDYMTLTGGDTRTILVGVLNRDPRHPHLPGVYNLLQRKGAL